MADRDEFEKGDKVEWDWGGQKIGGKVVKKLTEDTKIKSHVAKASEDSPQYLVKSDKTGKEAAHKPEDITSTDD